MKSKMKIAAVALSVLVVGGGVLYSINKEAPAEKPIENAQGTSAMLNEELAAKGTIDKIETSEEGVIITVGQVKISVHASTNIFEGDELLSFSDLKEGQNVEVYSDGVQAEILNGLRVEVLK